MKYRKLGRTNFDVSEIGYGAWGMGGSMWIGASDKESLDALRFALHQGVNFIDTCLGLWRRTHSGTTTLITR